MGAEILVVQHGEKVRAAGDPGLTDTGVGQARGVAAWLTANRSTVRGVWSSPLLRAQQTAEPISVAIGVEVQIDVRLRERMNWDDESTITLAGFLAEWHLASADRSYRPTVGDSSHDAAARFLSALTDIGRAVGDGTAVVVAHGGVTVDTLRTLAGDTTVNDADPDLIDNGVPCCAITSLRVDDEAVSIDAYPSARHLDETIEHRPA